MQPPLRLRQGVRGAHTQRAARRGLRPSRSSPRCVCAVRFGCCARFLPSAVFGAQSGRCTDRPSTPALSSGAALTQLLALPRPPSRCWLFFHALSGLPSLPPFRRRLLPPAALCAWPITPHPGLLFPWLQFHTYYCHLIHSSHFLFLFHSANVFSYLLKCIFFKFTLIFLFRAPVLLHVLCPCSSEELCAGAGGAQGGEGVLAHLGRGPPPGPLPPAGPSLSHQGRLTLGSSRTRFPPSTIL